MQLPVTDITPLIPQKPPFVLISRLLHTDGQITGSQFDISADHVMIKDGLLTEGGLLENIAQTAAASAGFMAINEGRDVQEGYIASVKNLEIFRLPSVGETLTTEVSLLDSMAGMNIISGQVNSGDETIARCEMRILLKQEAGE